MLAETTGTNTDVNPYVPYLTSPPEDITYYVTSEEKCLEIELGELKSGLASDQIEIILEVEGVGRVSSECKKCLAKLELNRSQYSAKFFSTKDVFGEYSHLVISYAISSSELVEDASTGNEMEYVTTETTSVITVKADISV